MLGSSALRQVSFISLQSCFYYSLLQTVPSDVLNQGKEIADAYRAPEDDVKPEELDPEIKQLESLL